jgi:hypothetical protein
MSSAFRAGSATQTRGQAAPTRRKPKGAVLMKEGYSRLPPGGKKAT